ncbi:MAG: hypothetical protein ABIZ52_00075 [Candidatus Limnocylindrales bacterium]
MGSAPSGVGDPVAAPQLVAMPVAAAAPPLTPPPTGKAPIDLAGERLTTGAFPPQVGRAGTSPLQLVLSVVGVSIGVAALAIALAIAGQNDVDPGTGDTGTDGSSSGNQVVDVLNIRAEVPAEWQVVTRAKDTIVVQDTGSHALWLRSARLPGPITFEQIQQRYLDKARGQSPDAKVCAGPETAAVPGGPAGGRYLVICSTYVPQGGGPAVRLADVLYLGLDGDAVTAFVMQLTAVPGAVEGFATQVRALPPPVWKLYGG